MADKEEGEVGGMAGRRAVEVPMPAPGEESTPDEKLRVAVADGPYEDLIEALREGARVDSVPIQELLDESLLSAAEGSFERMDLLWRHPTAPRGFDMEPAPGTFDTIFAADNGGGFFEEENPRGRRLAELALAAGANPWAARKLCLDAWEPWITAIELAAREGQLGALSLLVDRGVDPNALGPRGQTPLLWAAEDGRPRVAAFLAPLIHDLDATGTDGTAKGLRGTTTALEDAERGARAAKAAGQDDGGHAEVARIIRAEKARREAEKISEAAGPARPNSRRAL